MTWVRPASRSATAVQESWQSPAPGTTTTAGVCGLGRLPRTVTATLWLPASTSAVLLLGAGRRPVVAMGSPGVRELPGAPPSGGRRAPPAARRPRERPAGAVAVRGQGRLGRRGGGARR